MAKKRTQPKVHEALSGFNIRINTFGEIITNLNIDVLNEFLNENVADKKLKEKYEKEAA
ncbi:MAG: hypothetical protein ACJAUH_001630 [Saprospiraceae bacterium]|jgi:hypothetical protein